MGLIGVQRREGNSVIKGATVGGQAVLQIVVVERIQRHNRYVICIVQDPPYCIGLQLVASGPQSQSNAVCKAVPSALFFAMHHSSVPTTPVWALEIDELTRSGSMSAKKRKILEEEEETKKSFFHFAFLGDPRERNSQEKCF